MFFTTSPKTLPPNYALTAMNHSTLEAGKATYKDFHSADPTES